MVNYSKDESLDEGDWACVIASLGLFGWHSFACLG